MDPEEFRKERDSLGRLAANYLDAVRAAAAWPPLQLKSLWTWDQRKNLPTSPPDRSPNDWAPHKERSALRRDHAHYTRYSSAKRGRAVTHRYALQAL